MTIWSVWIVRMTSISYKDTRLLNNKCIFRSHTFAFFLHKLCRARSHSNFISQIKIGVISGEMVPFKDFITQLLNCEWLT